MPAAGRPDPAGFRLTASPGSASTVRQTERPVGSPDTWPPAPGRNRSPGASRRGRGAGTRLATGRARPRVRGAGAFRCAESSPSSSCCPSSSEGSSPCGSGPRPGALAAPSGGSGEIEGTTVELSSRVGARILEQRVKEGQRVKANDLLVRLDCADPEAQLAEAQSRLAAAKAQATSAMAQLSVSDRNRVAARASEQAAKAQAAALAAQRGGGGAAGEAARGALGGRRGVEHRPDAARARTGSRARPRRRARRRSRARRRPTPPRPGSRPRARRRRRRSPRSAPGTRW